MQNNAKVILLPIFRTRGVSDADEKLGEKMEINEDRNRGTIKRLNKIG